MAEGPAIALRYMKDNLDEALLFDFATARDHEAERLIRTTMTADHREAVQAFIEKRQRCSRAINIATMLGASGIRQSLTLPVMSGWLRRQPPAGAGNFLRRESDVLFKAHQLPVVGMGVKAKAGLAGERDHGLVGAQGIAEQARGAESCGAALQIARATLNQCPGPASGRRSTGRIRNFPYRRRRRSGLRRRWCQCRRPSWWRSR